MLFFMSLFWCFVFDLFKILLFMLFITIANLCAMNSNKKQTFFLHVVNTIVSWLLIISRCTLESLLIMQWNFCRRNKSNINDSLSCCVKTKNMVNLKKKYKIKLKINEITLTLIIFKLTSIVIQWSIMYPRKGAR